MSTLNLDWTTIISTVVAAVLVGMTTSYVATQEQIGTIEERVSRAEEDIVRLRKSYIRERKAKMELKEDVARMEVKLDVLLQTQGIDPSDLNVPRN